MFQTEDNTKKKVLFIQTNFWRTENFFHPIHHVPSITLKYAAALVKAKCNYDVEIADCAVDNISPEDIVKKILVEKPLAIVISAASFSAEKACDFARRIKENDEKIFTIGTGHAAVSSSQKCLFSKNFFDLYLEGDCEQEIANSIARIENNNISEIKKGLEKDANSTAYNLDDLPFPEYTPGELRKYEFIYPVKVKKKVLCGYIISSRGCMHNCIFCTQTVRRSYSDKMTFRSASNVVDEIEELMSKGVNLIDFIDDNFCGSREHVVSICKEITRRNLRINWVAAPRIDELDRELLLFMKKAGCILVLLSVESGSERIIKLLGKTKAYSSWIEKVRSVFCCAKEVGIGTCALFMVGNPTETEKDVEESVSLAKELDADFIKVHFFTPYPGTEIYKRYAGILGENALGEMHHYLPPIVNVSNMSMKKLRSMQRHFYKKVFFRNCFIASHISTYINYYLYNPAVLKLLFAFCFNLVVRRLNKDTHNRSCTSKLRFKKA